MSVSASESEEFIPGVFLLEDTTGPLSSSDPFDWSFKDGRIDAESFVDTCPSADDINDNNVLVGGSKSFSERIFGKQLYY